MSRALSLFSRYPNLHNSDVNCFIDSFNCKRDTSSVLMEYCPESCIWKVKYLCINGTRNSLLIHGFWLVNARLLMAFGTAFYAIIPIHVKYLESAGERTNSGCCCFVILRPRLTAEVMSGRSVNLTTLFLGRLRPPKRLTGTSCTYFGQ